jgi:hypothetical protein
MTTLTARHALEPLMEAAAHRFNGAVFVVDANHRVVAHAAPTDRVCNPFATAILTRRLPSEIRRLLTDPSVRQATGPVVVQPGSVSPGHIIVCPIRYQDVGYGYLMGETPSGIPSEEAQALLLDTAERAGIALRRRDLYERMHAETEQELAGRLLGGVDMIRRSAAQRLLERHAFPVSPVVAVAVLQGRTSVPRAALQAATVSAVTRAGFRNYLSADCLDHAVVLLPSSQVEADGRTVSTTARELHRRITEELGWDTQLVIGYGIAQEALADAWVSMRQAVHAAWLALRVPSLGPTVGWSGLGMFSVVTLVPPERVRTELLAPAVTAFLDSPDNAALIDTLERFLDLGGDVKSAAAALSVHPATIRYRLERIERTLGASLKDGEDRFVLHFAVKWHRVALGASLVET